MKQQTKQFLFWSPRVLTLLVAVFLSLFALGVFGEGYGFWGTAVALFMHLIPTWIVLAEAVNRIAGRWRLTSSMDLNRRFSPANRATRWQALEEVLGVSLPRLEGSADGEARRISRQTGRWSDETGASPP